MTTRVPFAIRSPHLSHHPFVGCFTGFLIAACGISFPHPHIPTGGRSSCVGGEQIELESDVILSESWSMVGSVVVAGTIFSRVCLLPPVRLPYRSPPSTLTISSRLFPHLSPIGRPLRWLRGGRSSSLSVDPSRCAILCETSMYCRCDSTECSSEPYATISFTASP